jgi:hypothetical protein
MQNYNMNHNRVACLTIIVISLLITGCGGSEKESEKDRTNRLLKSTTWNVTRVTVDGVDKTSDYTGMTLKISDGTYTSTNGESVWPASGVWMLLDKTTAERDNNETVHIDALSEATLTLSLDWQKTTFGEGRIGSIKGAYVFEFIK